MAEGEDLPDWHFHGVRRSEEVHRRGISVRGRVISENDVDMDKIEDYVVDADDEDETEDLV